jgi:hypothetical protein
MIHHPLTDMFADYARHGPWTGGDSTASVQLPDGGTAWLFSDTMLGTVNDDHTRNPDTPMVHNSAVVKDHRGVTYTALGGPPDAPTALIPAPTPGDYCWIGDGTWTPRAGVQVIVNTYHTTGPGQFDFALTGTALATLTPDMLTTTDVQNLNLGAHIAWGSALIDLGGWTYIYGSENIPHVTRHAHVARTPTGHLGDPWEYFNGRYWSEDPGDSARILSGVGTAFGVQQDGYRLVMVTFDCGHPFTTDLLAYEAEQPRGPWTVVARLGRVPLTKLEMVNGRWLIAYDARVHPQLAPPGTMLVSYNVNSTDPDTLYSDARVYRPRFFTTPTP